MEKHTCKLCSRSFANGRALGGHMRSHVTSSNKAVLPIRDSVSSSSFSSSKAPASDLDKGSLAYRLRENPKKSTRLIVQDYESDAESIHDHRRSKRVRKSLPESEPVSSLSSATMEEDVAISLMMLSRDIWHKSGEEEVLSDDDADADADADADEERIRIRPVNHPKRSKYQCGTCRRVFRSYQALGGHRASHKKTNGCAPPQTPPVKIYEFESMANYNNVERIEHECPICYRVFSSGQALGGHKRSHLMAANPAANFANKSNGQSWIDLNLPAPVEDDAEQSAICDA